MSHEIKQVMVVGSGVMGLGILKSFQHAGFDCLLFSRNPDNVRDLPTGARVTDRLPDQAPDLVVESIPEKLELKLALFQDLDAYAGQSILATNTSALPLEDLANVLTRPDMFCGLHYLQPAETFDFVELIACGETDPAVLDRVEAALAKTGKQAIRLSRPIIGFLINRLQHAFLHEAYHLIEQGIVDVETVDLVAKKLLGPRMCVTGVIEQKDLSGLDTHAASQAAIVPELYRSAEPSKLVQRMAADGRLGVKTGQGFYDWSSRDVPAVKRAAAEKLARILEIVREPDAP